MPDQAYTPGTRGKSTDGGEIQEKHTLEEGKRNPPAGGSRRARRCTGEKSSQK